MEETTPKKRGRKKGKAPKYVLEVRLPADLEDAVNSAAMYVTGGNKNAYVCQLVFRDLEQNHEKYEAAAAAIDKARKTDDPEEKLKREEFEKRMALWREQMSREGD